MSGTSVDAIDVAICDLSPTTEPHVLGLHLLGFREEPFPSGLRRTLLELLRDGNGSLDLIAEINVRLGEAFGNAVSAVLNHLGLSRADVDLVASHGQTIYHLVEPDRERATLQVGEPAVIAALTGMTVVADFRVADVAAGGQGAPLVAFLDRLVFGGDGKTRAIQNIGGMANVTFLLPDGDAYAFDTGPGNALIDYAAWTRSGGRQRFDRDGLMAANGTADDALVAEVLAHPYFAQPPPKTTGRELFGDGFAANFMQRAAARGCAPEDMVATLTAITAESIARAYRDFGPERIDEVVLSGGGSLNPTLVREIARRLLETRVTRSDDHGLPAAAKEAIAFALLGHETLHGRPANLPRCTGAARPAILGKIIPGDNYRDLMKRIIGEKGESWPVLEKVQVLSTSPRQA